MLMFPNIVAFLFFPNCQKQDYTQYFSECKADEMLRNAETKILLSQLTIPLFKAVRLLGSLTVSYFKITLQAL